MIVRTGPAIRQSAIACITAVWGIAVYGVTALTLLGRIDAVLMVPILLWFCAYAVLLRFIVPRLRDRSKRTSEMKSLIVGRVVDGYTNILTVKLFARLAHEDRHVREVFEQHTSAYRSQMRLLATLFMSLQAMNALMLPGRQVFLVDTHINYDPSAQQIAAITQMAARKIMRFGITPKAALLSHSNFGSSNQPSAVKMREALAILQAEAPWLEVDGEMHGDVALDAEARVALMPRTTLAGDANLLVCPNIDAANIAYNLLKTAAGGNIAIGPMLLGVARPAHILTASATVRRIVNMTALTVAEANVHR